MYFVVSLDNKKQRRFTIAEMDESRTITSQTISLQEALRKLASRRAGQGYLQLGNVGFSGVWDPHIARYRMTSSSFPEFAIRRAHAEDLKSGDSQEKKKGVEKN